ncbi:SlyX family protein [Zooshikella marina]|uniref:SlyX protein n=1 Tax=Zooshikella ganghwensis TaxID=202772 RepID=A0A4V1INA8_9GAMM|nr:SlyX family protein [Zooshikella ganghwensis]MBU2704701.1 SlyX family protein [Zooshikella ganghwensis]RDH43081.1 SlyX protein [Zooshikella ganghwensis]
MDQMLIDLQTQVAFQEDLLQALNKVVAEQQQSIDALRREVDYLKDQLQVLPELIQASQQAEKPPHY